MSTLRPRPNPQPTAQEQQKLIQTPPPPETPPETTPARTKTYSQKAVSTALTSTANLAKHLPTGTLLAFQLLTPIFTNNGSCDAVTRLMTEGLLCVLAASCFLACFTDSVQLSDGKVYHGFATFRGIWFFDYDNLTGIPADLSRFRIRFADLVHGVLSVLVFASVALRDWNVVSCLYPRPARETEEVLDILPLGIGVICGLLFCLFPTRRHGIGYPVSKESSL